MIPQSRDDPTPEEVASFFMRHFVPIQFTFSHINSESSIEYATKAFSAFVISVNNIWFLITAGHCIGKVDKCLRAGWLIENCLLLDGFGSEAKHHDAPHFDYLKEAHTYQDDRDLGLDYGVIVLREYYVNLLRANGVVALDETAWLDKPESPKAYFLMGLPDELQEMSVKLSKIQPMLIELEQTLEPPDLLVKEFDRFYANIVSKESPESISGMSGGPILAIQEKSDGNLEYRLVAIQSSWIKDTRVIAACYVRDIALHLDWLMKNPPWETSS